MREPGEIDDWLAGREADVTGLREGCAKRVDWSGAPGEVTPVALVYVHGFSASSGEIDPVPGRVAHALGANIHYTRLAGHGCDGAAMGQPRLEDWRADVREALEIGRAIGESVIVISCSTGATLVTLELVEVQNAIAATIFVSPNFGLTNAVGQRLLDVPGVRRWGQIITGRTRSVRPLSEAHRRIWTLEYDTRAVFTMGEAVRAVRTVDVTAISVPAAFIFNDTDQVVSAEATRAVARSWGGPVEMIAMGPGGDEMGHLIMGDVFSPDQTPDAVAHCLTFLRDRLRL